MKKIGLITYQTNHLKTEQIFKKLVKKYSAENFTFYGLPFVQRAKRNVLFNHRPDQSLGRNTLDLAKEYGCKYVTCETDSDINFGEDIYLILGAGILSAECVRGKKILNAHPGIIPTSRGLDAFKWAVFEGDPVGNSLHFIDEKVDAGEIVAVKKTPVYAEDTLENFANRHYEIEIDMMSNFEHYLNHRINDFPNAPIKEPHMRMKFELEKNLFDKFETFKIKFAEKDSTSNVTRNVWGGVLES